MTTLVIDIGGTKLAAALAGPDLTLTGRREIPTPASKTPDVLQAEGVLTGQVLGAGGALAKQGGQGEALAAGALEGGLPTGFDQVLAFADHAPLFDDVEVLDRAVGGFDDAFATGIETQLALLDQIRQMAVLHLVEGWEALQKLQRTLYVLQHSRPARLAVGVLFTHDTDRIATPNYIYLYIGAGLVVLGPHGRLAEVWGPLDGSLWAACDQYRKARSYR